MIARSYLYVGGDPGGRLERSAARGADADIADIEEAIAPALKADAVAAWLAPCSEDCVQRWMRINAGRLGLDDLRAVLGPGLDGIVIPKVSSAGRPAYSRSPTPGTNGYPRPTFESFFVADCDIICAPIPMARLPPATSSSPQPPTVQCCSPAAPSRPAGV